MREHRTTEQMPPAFIEAYETPGTVRLHLDLAAFAAEQPAAGALQQGETP